MNPVLIAALFAIFVLFEPAVAQADNPFDGSWIVSADGKKIADMGGSVVINGDSGTWDIVADARKNPCIGRKYPITVQNASADELVFTVNRASTLIGCKDSTYTFKKVDDKTLKGELGAGRAVSLTRQ